MKKEWVLFAMALAALLFFGGASSSYATLTYSDWLLFPQSTTPIPSGITATFTQNGEDHVTLTMSLATDVDPTIKIDQWGFNYIKGVTLSEVSFVSGTPEATKIYTTWGQKTKADGDGFFSLSFNFPASGDTLSAGDKIVYDLYGAGLVEDSFIFKSAQYADGTSSAAYNGYYSAIHALTPSLIPGTPGFWAGATDFHSAVVPIPTTAWLLASGLIGVVVIRRRFGRQ